MITGASYPEPLFVCGIELQGDVLYLQLDEHVRDLALAKGGVSKLTWTRVRTLIVPIDGTQVLLS